MADESWKSYMFPKDLKITEQYKLLSEVKKWAVKDRNGGFNGIPIDTTCLTNGEKLLLERPTLPYVNPSPYTLHNTTGCPHVMDLNRCQNRHIHAFDLDCLANNLSVIMKGGQPDGWDSNTCRQIKKYGNDFINDNIRYINKTLTRWLSSEFILHIQDSDLRGTAINEWKVYKRNLTFQTIKNTRPKK